MRTDQSLASEHSPDATPDGGPDDSPPAVPPAGPPTIEVKRGAVEVLQNAAEWSTAELARRGRLDQSAVARLLRGDLRPGPRLIGGLLLAFSTRFPKIGFYDLFELVDTDGTVLTPQVTAAVSEIAATSRARSA